jgi:hypothetical protein
MRRVIVESPFAGDVALNVRYARACIRDCLLRGEAPMASHLLYTQRGVLNDDRSDHRDLGIAAGFAWAAVADATVVYTDLGISKGMAQGMADADFHDRPIEVRKLGSSWELEPEPTTRWPWP